MKHLIAYTYLIQNKNKNMKAKKRMISYTRDIKNIVYETKKDRIKQLREL
ncbi:MAG: hypothetical protein H6767_06565 [Candidatus Peribacteria bacterium]|nr:MAG: hypothetical protein H6767_06565 [Candidatus Peribacteria bacterium]